MKYELTFSHDLVVPFDYHKNGQLAKAKSLTIKAPSNKVLMYVSILESEYSQALLKLSKLADNKQAQTTKQTLSKNDEAKQVVLILGSGGNLDRCYDALKSILLTSGICLVDGVSEFTSVYFDDMNPNDTKLILGKYLINFLDFSLAN